MRGRLAGAGVILLVAAAAMVGTAPAASAHTLSGVTATDYRSQVLTISPADPDLTFRLLDLGRRVELTNRGDTDVIVLGYETEPYLRIGPRGTFENRRSPTLYKNRVTTNGATASVPATADGSARPEWHKTSSGRTVRWRDHRTRWEGADPPAVKGAPGRTHVVASPWTITLQRGASTVAITGRIVYEPPPPVLPWAVAGVVLLALTAAAGAAKRWGPLLSAALAVLIAIDVVQSFASGAVSGDRVLVLVLKVLLGGVFSTVAWVVGAIAIGPLQRSREGALVGAGVAGLFIALFSGLSDLGTLASSQVPSTLPPWAARSGVTVALGIGLGLVAAVFVVIRTNPDVSLVPPAAATGAPRSHP
ncbi:MAG: hypothetical protein QOE35_3024 [Actinomycetota bacterium]|jgi:hypothetical protein